MKIKKVLGVVALLSSMPFAFNANNLTHVVCAADVEPTTINVIVTDSSNKNHVIINPGDPDVENDVGFEGFDEGTSGTLTKGGNKFIEFYGGDYIQSKTPVTIKGETSVDFLITLGSSSTKYTYKQDVTIGVYDFVSGSLISSTTVRAESKLAEEFDTRNPGNKDGLVPLEIPSTGKYIFRLSSHAKSDKNNHAQLKLTSFTYTPFVEAPSEPDVGDPVLPDQRTLSQMAFSYNKDDEGAYNIGDVVLRYGAVLPYVDWSALDINAYGVALTKSSNLEGSLSDLIGSTDLSDPSARAGFDKVSFAMGDMDNVARVNADGDLFVEDAEGEYVLFNARLSVPSSNYHTEINAVAFVVVAGKTVLFEEVVGDSVASQARYYLDNGSYSGDVYDVLNILAA